jgi:perosamine synthetase
MNKALDNVRLRPACAEDMKCVFEWRNDPWIVSHGTHQRTVDWEEHKDWFKRVIGGDDRELLIVQINEHPIGQVRFDQVNRNQAVVSIYLLMPYTGKGYGTRALQQACQIIFDKWDISEVIACVGKDNVHSLCAFRKAGFVQLKETNDQVCLTIHRQIPHNKLTFGIEEQRAVSEVVMSGYWAGGPRLSQLEQALAIRAGVNYAIGTSSGVSALRLALRALNVQPKEEILVPAYSCVALANAVLSLDAIPISVDVRPDDWNLDPLAAKRALTKRSAVVIAVHTFGAPAPIVELKALGLPVIEDCAHAFGSAVQGNCMGSLGDISMLSFYATKLMGAGEGGAVLTDQKELALSVYEGREYADSPMDKGRLNDKMNDMEAALALTQLARLDDMLLARQERAELYTELLRSLEEHERIVRLPVSIKERVWYRYVVELIHFPASAVIQRLRQFRIQAEIPITDWRKVRGISTPVANNAYTHNVSLPLYPRLELDELKYICLAFRNVIEEISR